MKILGLKIPFTGGVRKALLPMRRANGGRVLAPATSARTGGWWPIIRESFAGAWQQNVEIRFDSVLSYFAVFSCQSLIASDISKLRLKLVALDGNGIWNEVANPAYSPVLRKPNHFQTRMQFYEGWVLSKLQAGNAYILKQRDARNVVVKLYVLDPLYVTPLVSESGDVFYELTTDQLVGLTQTVTVPAREIIHDRFNCFFHPLVGLSPIFACGLAAMQGLAIQNNSAGFFQNGSTMPGVLTAPGAIGDETAKRLKEHWEANYTGSNAGKVAVLGDGLKYEGMAVKAVDAQLVDQLKFTAEVVCSTYHVPPYKIGIGQMPTYNNIQALNTEYYSQCLQVLIEAIELCLDEGLGTGDSLGTEFDIDNLLRMDSKTQVETIKELVGAGVGKPNEGRKRLNLGPVEGGDTPYLQQQNFSLAALAKRDARPNPFSPGGGGTTAPPADEPDPAPPPEDAAAETERAVQAMMRELAA